ncbi:serine/threonine protein kinase [Streptomyces griseoluteus]|uniref:serine/threonine protein kinase n=1 Tax=Streptomyces griseoluteus TaxID=29306 RepID=UPI0037FC0E83
MTMGKAHVSAHGLIAGRYRVLEIVHRETNRVCWYGEDVEAGRPRLLTQVGLPEGTDEDTARRVTARVLRRSETMSLLRPGRVATVVDAVTEAGTLWTVAEWIDGTPLAELVAEKGTFSYVRAARIGLELLDVLEAAHAEGVTHGELSPGQVFVGAKGDVVVAGYGLVGATLAPRLTAPSYASPEQARDERVGPASDLWALGAVLYTMVEGRPPFRDRGPFEATLRSVDRLPPRGPLRAGPLAQAVRGLLRKDARERLSAPVVRDALARALREDPGTVGATPPRPRSCGVRAAVRHAGRSWSRHTLAAGTALAVVALGLAVLAVTHRLPGTGSGGSSAAGTASRPPASATVTPPQPGGSAGGGPAQPSATATRPGPPSGYRLYRAQEGFSVALPANWSRLRTTRVPGPAYRVTFGASGDARTLAVTYSERVGPDPVAVWRDEVEPGLKRTGGYRRVGDIRATTYQGRGAADMDWLSGTGEDRVRTFGRGFLLGGRRGFSLRWTTPAADFGAAVNRQALAVFLRTFRPGPA